LLAGRTAIFRENRKQLIALQNQFLFFADDARFGRCAFSACIQIAICFAGSGKIPVGPLLPQIIAELAAGFRR
jgi:hypothetical protein